MTDVHTVASPGEEAALGATRVDARSAPKSGSMYKEREPVFPKLVRGKFRNIKWAVMIVALGIYYGLPWIRLDRGPGMPDQAFLLDFARQRLYFFWLEIWAQEFYYITGILVISGAGAVPASRRGRARLVRLCLPADRLDRPYDPGRALLAGRPQRAHQARQGALVVRQSLAQGRHASAPGF